MRISGPSGMEKRDEGRGMRAEGDDLRDEGDDLRGYECLSENQIIKDYKLAS